MNNSKSPKDRADQRSEVQLSVAAICAAIMVLIGVHAPLSYEPAKLWLAGSGVAMLYLCMFLHMLDDSRRRRRK